VTEYGDRHHFRQGKNKQVVALLFQPSVTIDFSEGLVEKQEKMTEKYQKLLIIFVLIGLMSFIPELNYAQASQPSTNSDISTTSGTVLKTDFVGPRKNVPADAPADNGFSMFAIPVEGVISRSGQPTCIEYIWLKKHGWKSVVNLRDESDDTKIQGFNELGFNYFSLPIEDGGLPNNQQAEKFLAFVTNPLNQPVHVHCRMGIGRAGLMIALYRYAVKGWPMDKAISESRLFYSGVNARQKDWLEKWAQEHKPGEIGDSAHFIGEWPNMAIDTILDRERIRSSSCPYYFPCAFSRILKILT
jgi:protein tyrosine/serine phosphatase